MSTQGTQHPPLPEELQKEISIATQKVVVLKEEAIDLAREKTVLEKDIARLQLRIDELNASIESLVAREAAAISAAEDAERRLTEIKTSSDSTNLDLSEALRALDKAKYDTGEEAKKLSEIVVRSRELEAEILAKKEAIEAEVQAIELRKKNLIEAIANA